ncbi:MAG: TolC family protein [Synergistaceae bacterium]|jgi:outer membrane protein TolC|nr:TolC family protein [Synergistaceae bacterium]
MRNLAGGICLSVFMSLAVFARPSSSAMIELTLEKAEEMALINSKQVKIAESDIIIANEGLRQARRTNSIGVSLTHNSSTTSVYTADIEERSYSNTITAAYPIYTGGKIESGIKAADIEVEIKKMSLSKIIQDVRLSVVVGLYSILRAEDMVKSYEESLGRLVAHSDNVLIQYENGKVSKADLLRSEVEVSNEEQTLTSARNTLETAVKQLNSALGVPLETKLIIEETMSYKKIGRSLEECIEYAMQNRPDLKSAMLEIKWAKAGVSLAKSEKAPQATLSMTQNLNSDANWPGYKQDYFNITLEIDYKIFDSGVADSKIASAKETTAKATLGYEQIKEALELEVTSCFLSIQEAERRIFESETVIDKAKEAYEIAVARYGEGVGTNIDVIDSQVALTQANSNYTQALCDYNISLARLENAMGGNFSDMKAAKHQ